MNESSLTLLELNQRVKEAIRDYLPETYWVRAEASDVRQNRNGHCYLEFIEKDKISQSIIAKARGVIWANVFQMLSAYFENETGQRFGSGINVLVRVSVEFHELYGYSLTVVDIDPSFTLGELARNRQLVLKKLEEEGVLTLNKELQLPEIANRIAVISSPTAAGFEDFCDQLSNNPMGLVFYTKLFPAIMQGDKSEASIIAALEEIYQHHELFDAVAIIRGGGSTSDLNCFDSYHLASNVAQFPLPVISGIGHERDVTVLDVVAHTRAKTPTAVAEFFISHLSGAAAELIDLQERLLANSSARLLDERTQLLSLTKDVVHQSTLLIQRLGNKVEQLSQKLKYGVIHFLQVQSHELEGKKQYVEMVSPENILKRGYTLTLKDGKIVTSLVGLSTNDQIVTRFKDGVVTSNVIETKKIFPEKETGDKTN